MLALLVRGYAVHGFDPVDGYVRAAREAVAAWPGTKLETLSIQQWARGATGSYDAVFTGWGVWAHVILQRDRLEALRAFRRVCPSGPLLLSFFSGDPVFDATETPSQLEELHAAAPGRARRVLRALVRERLLGREPVERGSEFRNGIFFHNTTKLELEQEAHSSGWRVAWYEQDVSKYPNAVLV